MKFANSKTVLPGAQSARGRKPTGKIRPGPFLPWFRGLPVAVGDVGECDVPSACLGMRADIGGD